MSMSSVTPLQNDVLFGRGYAISAHPGNQILRTMVRAHKPIFLQRKKTEKREVAQKIVNDVIKLGGRFLIEDPNNYANASRRNDREGIYEKAWICVDVEKAVDKVMHRLREKDMGKGDGDPRAMTLMDGQLQQINPIVANRNNSQSNFASSGKASNGSSDPSATASPASVGLVRGSDPALSDAAFGDFLLSIDLGLNNSPGSAKLVGESPSQLFQKVSSANLAAPQQMSNQNWKSDTSQPSQNMNQCNMMKNLCQRGGSPTPNGQSQRPPDGAQNSSPHIGSSQEVTFMAAKASMNLHPMPASEKTSETNKSEDEFGLKGVTSNPGNSLFLLEANNPVTSFPISVQEFLKSGSMSRQIMLMEDDFDVSDPQGAANSGVEKQRTMENSARLALLLTRLFANCPLGTVDVSIELKDFFVYLEQNAILDMGSKKAILLHIGMLNPAKILASRDQDDYSQPLAVQILGKLLYSIFSLGEPLAPSILANPESLSGGDAASTVPQDSDIMERLSKSYRPMDKSVFSRLAEGGILPVSVYRLLSDMLDIGPKGKDRTDMPLKSFEDVIQDLEQMVRLPEKFLHDSGLPLGGSQKQAMFGQASYGRSAEISCLVEVTNRMVQSLNQSDHGFPQSGVEAVFVSGIAGSGKSLIIDEVGNALSSSGWLVIKGKFERGLEHTSRRIVSSIFDEVVSYLVKMKESGRKKDVAFVQRASTLILDGIGVNRLSSLVDFLPSLPLLFGNIAKASSPVLQTEDTEWRLIFCMSKILGSVLESGRFIMICCDDLQWSDKGALSLISEVLVNIGSVKQASRRCLFVGSFRHDEIDGQHPFSIQYAYIQMMTSNIHTTKIDISSLSKEGVEAMLTAEFQLPHRYVRTLADVVHKKTSGHAFFVVELLNSFLRDSIITFNQRRQCYSWDQDVITFIPTGEGVAGLIASNLKSLPPESQQVLRILSCIGTQTDIPLLQILEELQGGIMASIAAFVEMGILDQAGPVVMFAHDLIQQSMYESMPVAERQALHLEIGQYLGALANVDKPETLDPITQGMGSLQLENREFFGGGRALTSSLISIACDQIDCVGPGAICDEEQKIQFAKYNLAAGKQAYVRSNSHAAFHYYSNGIAFLGPNCWHESRHRLCLELHVGLTKAAFTLGEPDKVSLYAEKVAANGSFDDSMEIQPLVLISLSQSGKHEESITKGLSILRELDFDLSSDPTPGSVMQVMAITDGLASQFNMDQLMNLCDKTVDDTVHRVLKVMDAFYTSCYASSSPFLPLVACVIIQFSFQHGICLESTVAFATFGMLKIFLAGDYSGGLYWANAVREMESKIRSMNKSETNAESTCRLILHVAVDIFFQSPRTVSQQLVSFQQDAMKAGQVHLAMIAVGMSSRYLLLGGGNLSLLEKTYKDKMIMVAKHSKFVAKYLALDSLLLTTLTGKPGDYFSLFGGSICNMNDLQDEAKSTKDMTLLQSSHVFNVLIEFWRGNYMAAEEHSRHASMMIPASKEPTIYLIYHTFFRGIILFQLYRMLGGEQRLHEGKEMMNMAGKWAQNSMPVFENKWLLLQAEFHASSNYHDKALALYKVSIKRAQDHGNIHELALASELLGKCYLERGDRTAAVDCFKQAHVYYTQWGANAIAENIQQKYGLGMVSGDTELNVQTHKHSRSREWG